MVATRVRWIEQKHRLIYTWYWAQDIHLRQHQCAILTHWLLDQLSKSSLKHNGKVCEIIKKWILLSIISSRIRHCSADLLMLFTDLAVTQFCKHSLLTSIHMKYDIWEYHFLASVFSGAGVASLLLRSGSIVFNLGPLMYFC